MKLQTSGCWWTLSGIVLNMCRVGDWDDVDSGHLKALEGGRSAGTQAIDANSDGVVAHFCNSLPKWCSRHLGGNVGSFATVLETINASGSIVKWTTFRCAQLKVGIVFGWSHVNNGHLVKWYSVKYAFGCFQSGKFANLRVASNIDFGSLFARWTIILLRHGLEHCPSVFAFKQCCTAPKGTGSAKFEK